jgi:uncharacterized iron-regulated membrane protein
MVDPYSGKILGSSADKNAVSEFMQIMFSLHRWLLLDRSKNRFLENYQTGSWAAISAELQQYYLPWVL